MSDQTIALLALYVCLLAIAGCLSFRTMKRKGYVVSDRSTPWWQRLFMAPCRPHAGTRLFFNALFWATLFVALLIISSHMDHIRFLAVEDASPLSAEKFSEYADGELWALQVIAGSSVLGVTWLSILLAKRFKLHYAALSEGALYVIDDCWSIVLNFSSLFVISGWLKACEGKIQFLWILVLGFLNVVTYAFRPTLALEREETDKSSDSPNAAGGKAEASA
ncbi:MAG: hypothetical protein AAGC76_05335 [Luteibacter sp.]|uniref:hypothetical protein n=1 Tax=Luteibacter sp. TaxID=1886636 RepID=UPI00280A40DE|nr:hypothetical protein [Luteibacter sp.]MDQ7995260.1 hypothetical protein [Luteibacter sp.]